MSSNSRTYRGQANILTRARETRIHNKKSKLGSTVNAARHHPMSFNFATQLSNLEYYTTEDRKANPITLSAITPSKKEPRSWS